MNGAAVWGLLLAAPVLAVIIVVVDYIAVSSVRMGGWPELKLLLPAVATLMSATYLLIVFKLELWLVSVFCVGYFVWFQVFFPAIEQAVARDMAQRRAAAAAQTTGIPRVKRPRGVQRALRRSSEWGAGLGRVGREAQGANAYASMVSPLDVDALWERVEDEGDV